MIKKSKTISVLLSICLIVSMLTSVVPVSAVSSSDLAATSNTDYTAKYVAPDIIDKDELDATDYVGRVPEDERDLYTFIFKNGDGSNTMRVFSHPVKYVDVNGVTRDISLEISKNKDGAFTAADHIIKADFGSSITDEISFEYNDIKVSMKVLDANENVSADLSDDGKKLTYAVDDKTSYVYSLTYLGIKEDIVVSEYTGQTEYKFSLFTHGLHLVKIDNSVFLADIDGDIKATIGDIIIFTADERNNTFGDLHFETVNENEEYAFTIILDEDYLKNEKTAYPITIDPTIEINYDNNGAGAIEDVTINENVTFSGTSGSLYVGRHPAGSLSRTLMRFPNLSLSGITANRITAASVEIRDLMCQGDEDITIDCCIYNNSSPAWTESGTTTWSSVGTSYVGTVLDSLLVSYGHGNVSAHRYGFNILNLAKAWANETQSPAKGVVFKANSAFENQTGSNIKTWYKTFSSYNRSTKQPSLSITYKANVTVNVETTYLLVDGTKQINCTTSPSGLTVAWSSNNSSVATVNSTGLVTGVSEGTVKITATYTDSATGQSSSDYVYLYVKDSLGIKDNTTYYVMNYDSRRYMSLETASDANFTNVFTRVRSTSNLSQWKTEKQTDGRYQLISVYSSTGRVLDVSGTNVDIYTDNNASYEKFTIYRINSGAYKGLYYIRYGKYYVAQDADNNVYITTTASGKAVWSFMATTTSTRYANYYSIASPNTSGRVSNYQATMTSLGFSSNHWHCTTAGNAYTLLTTTNDIFTFIGHGLETSDGKGMATICFQTNDGEYNGYITANSAIVNGSSNRAIDSLSKNNLALERCVLYLGCKTGQTYTIGASSYNLVQSTFNKGAHFVLGTLETISVSEAYSFLDTFLANCTTGNIYDSISSILGDDPLFDAYYMGDSRQYIKVN